MTRKITSIDQLAVSSARQAQSQMAAMQRDLNALRDSVAGLNRTIRTPIVKAPRDRIKGATSSENWLVQIDGNLLLGALSDAYDGDGLNLSNGFYQSAAQKAGSALGTLLLGQRVR